jgi:hypothetical protein
MARHGRRLRSFVRFVPGALDAFTALELLVVRLFLFGVMLYGLSRLIATH